MKYDIKLDLGQREEEYAINAVAKQSNGSAWLKSGNTVIMASVTMDETEMVNDDFLPLTVQYIEKTYAAGKFPGGFIKRESKPSDFETLTSRIIDRSLRPLFPKGFSHPIQISILVFSVDEESDLQVLALNAASAALYTSDIDINISVAGVRVAKVDGAMCINPTASELKSSTLDLFLAGTKEDMLMIEMRSIGSEKSEYMPPIMIDPLLDPTMGVDVISEHSANALSEDELIEVLDKAHTTLNENNTKYEEALAKVSKESAPLTCKEDVLDENIVNYIKTNCMDAVKDAISHMAKSERSSALRAIRKDIISKEEFDESAVKKALESVKRERVRAQILEENVRADGRALNEVRPISIDTNLLPSAHASALFTRGQTQALVVLTIGGPKDAQMFENLSTKGTQDEKFMVHYNFPGFSVGEPSPIGTPRRRELGHGNLGKRALESSIVDKGDTLRLVSEILESNGSSSMATVCGGYMALRAGDIEMSDTIAGIAMGMVSENGKYAILSDIMGLEDHDGDMDFKVTGSKEGITAMQMDIKLGGISLDILKEALYQAKEGRSHIIDIMLKAEDEIEHNEGVLPTSDIFHIDPSFIGDVIGQAGKTIREIIEKFEVAIDIDKKGGAVKVSGKSKSGLAGAREHIENIVKGAGDSKVEYNVGDVVDGTVKKIVDFGAFIEIPGAVDGLLHISKVSKERVDKVSDVLSVGEVIKVEILEFKGNKISLGRSY